VISFCPPYLRCLAECDEAIVETWAEYFEDLATPVNQPSFDEKYKTQVEEDNKTLHAYYNSNKKHRCSFSISFPIGLVTVIFL
jgi:hypothetical protein